MESGWLLGLIDDIVEVTEEINDYTDPTREGQQTLKRLQEVAEALAAAIKGKGF